MTDPNYGYMSMRDYSLSLGESLTKVGRHELALLCLKGIQDELDCKPIPNKSKGRGRPPSPVGILAQRMEVHPDSIRRWMNLREVQASDYNSEKLAAMAVKFSPKEVARILQEDLTRYRDTMEVWLKRVAPNNDTSPCVKNKETEEEA